VDQNVGMFGSLFGVQNVSRFRPFLANGEIGHASWLTWTEIDHIDWEERAEPTEPIGLSSVDHVATRREALSEPWMLLFDLMRRLAQDYGGDNVRLVVRFSA
jgi:hypothetical protein